MRSYKGKIRKNISVRLVGDALEAFTKLNAIVEKQRQQGIQNSKEIKLLQAIYRIFDVIVVNPFYGENAKKALIPKEYRRSDVSNLFIVDLPDYWRMLYTLESDEVSIIAFVLDIVDHSVYNKKFKFRKR